MNRVRRPRHPLLSDFPADAPLTHPISGETRRFSSLSLQGLCKKRHRWARWHVRFAISSMTNQVSSFLRLSLLNPRFSSRFFNDFERYLPISILHYRMNLSDTFFYNIAFCLEFPVAARKLDPMEIYMWHASTACKVLRVSSRCGSSVRTRWCGACERMRVCVCIASMRVSGWVWLWAPGTPLHFLRNL